ncbi:GMP reductase 1-like [Athalia rosae]|uniref:GMP reductase 1-like n=1 Tax=Athalia rosae TaxID=37344 RepID=UPI00203493A6|nr:GMP reductase 1-like [Athalia rosae]
MPTIIDGVKLDYQDVLIRPRRSKIKSRMEVDLFTEITFPHSKRTLKSIPIFASNMDGTGTFEMAKALSKHGLLTAIHKYYTIEDWRNFARDNPECLGNVSVCAGTSDSEFQKISEIMKFAPEIAFITCDVANGYSEHFLEYVKKVRATFPNHTIIAGDVATPEMVEALVNAGTDIVNIGIGPGSVCTTRTKTGVGYPQLSAIIECADAAHGLGAKIIADGGCTCVGDIAKAFGAGADFVMLGGMLSGHDQGGGDTIERNGERFKLFYGLCSSTAMKIHSGGVAEYRSVEGKTVEVPYKGDVKVTVFDILGGLRSACTYVGAESLRELPSRTTFVRCARAVNTVFGPS